MAVRLTQEYTEVLITSAPTVRLTWLGVEVLINPIPNVRLTQLYVEVLTPSSVISLQDVEHELDITQNIVCNTIRNLSVQSTLSPTQDILAFNQLAVEHELDITQDIQVTKVISQEVTSTLTFTQEIAKVIPLEVISTLTLTDDSDSIKQKIANSSNTLTLTQDNFLNRVVNRRIDSNIFLVQSIIKNAFLTKIVGNTLTFTQSVLGVNSKFVSNTLIFSQDIDVEKAKLVRNTIEYTQSIFRQLTSVRTMISLFQPYHQITVNGIYNKTAENTLTFLQTIIAHVTKQITNVLTFNQLIDVLRVKHVQHTFDIQQTILFNQIRNLSIANQFEMFQEAICNKVYSRTVSNVLSFEQLLIKRKAYLREVTNTFIIGQEVYRTRYNETVTSTFTPSNIISKTWVANRAVNNQLNLSSTIGQNNIYSRTVVSNLIFLREFQIRVGEYVFNIPTIHVSKAQRYTVMTAGTRSIVLPNPEFSDAESNTGRFSLRRGMAGKVYTYVKKTDFRKLNYTFHVGRTKAKELMDFIIENNTNVVTINTFKGDIWYVYLTSNPNDMTTQSRFASACDPDYDREKVAITLEFEGVKVGSPMVNSPR